MSRLDELARWVDQVMTEETRRFVAEVPYASHLTDERDLDAQYYLRHRIETVRRIRSTASTDALALTRMVREDYAAARPWSRYVAEELGHDALFLRDLARHGLSEDEVLATPPFPATTAMVGFIAEEIERTGPLAAVAYSLLVEWSSERYSPKAVAKAERAFSFEHAKGARSHLGIDEDEEHYRMMLQVASRLLDRAGGLPVLERLIRTLCAHFRRYFTELYEATVGQGTAVGRPAAPQPAASA